MTLKQLQYFQALAQNLHYTKTAELLHIAQPSLSHAIAEMENELGVKLFTREDHTLQLSVYGREFLPYAENALGTVDKGIMHVRSISQGQNPIVRLGYIHSVSSPLIPEIVGTLRQADSEFRSLRFLLTEDVTGVLFRKLNSGNLDMIIAPDTKPGIVSVPILDQLLYLYVPAKHPLASRQSVSFADFSEEQLVVTDPGSSLFTLTKNYFREHGSDPNILIAVKESDSAIQYVELGLCCSILPSIPEKDRPSICVIPIEDDGRALRRSLNLSWVADRPMAAAIRRVRDYISSQYKF